tara:strand:- start:159 stop:956 length:798 start_codon:yes stop_codon:yes gene_type:complete
MNPTSELYQSLQVAYEHFNQYLFEGELPEVIFTVQRKKGVTGYFAQERWGNLSGKKCHEIAINPSYIANSRLIEVMQTLVHEMVHCWQFCYGRPGRGNYHNMQWAKKMINIGLMPSSTGEPGGVITGEYMADYIIQNGLFLNSFNILKENNQFQLSWIDRKALPRLFDPIICATNFNNLNDDKSSSTVGVVNQIASYKDTDKLTEYDPSKEKSFSEILPKTFIFEDVPKKPTRIRYFCVGCSTILYGKANLNINCNDCDIQFKGE